MTSGRMTQLMSMQEYAVEHAKIAGADFITAIASAAHGLRHRIMDGEVRQPKEVDEGNLILTVWKGGRAMTMNSLPYTDKISETIRLMLAMMEKAEFPETDLVFPEGPHAGVFDSSDPKVAELSHGRATDLIRAVRGGLESAGLLFDGVLSQAAYDVAIATTHGTRMRHTSTSLGFSVYGFDREEATTPGKARLLSAFSYGGGQSFGSVDASRLVREVVRKAALQRGAKKWNPFARFSNHTGEQYFDVIVEPPFMGPVLTWLFAFGGFNGKMFFEGQSFLSGKMGKEVFGENITIWDDPFHPAGMPNYFDWEGVPKRKRLLVEKGVLRGVCLDSTLAKRARAEGFPDAVSTGHALPGMAAVQQGAYPANVVLEGGGVSVEDMVRASKFPTIWITKEHYLGLKHFQTGTITGTAQHGVFLVANGEVICPVENMRFEMPIPEALQRVSHLGEPQLTGGTLGGEDPYVVPPMRIEGFRFIGATARTT